MESHELGPEHAGGDDGAEERVEETEGDEVRGDAPEDAEEGAHGEGLLRDGEEDRGTAVDEVADVVADALVGVVGGALRLEGEVGVVGEVLAQEETGEPETPLEGDEALDVLVHGEQRRGDHDDEEVSVHRGVETGDVLAAQGGGHVALDVREDHHQTGRRGAEGQHHQEKTSRAAALVAVVVDSGETKGAHKRRDEPRGLALDVRGVALGAVARPRGRHGRDRGRVPVSRNAQPSDKDGAWSPSAGPNQWPIGTRDEFGTFSQVAARFRAASPSPRADFGRGRERAFATPRRARVRTSAETPARWRPGLSTTRSGSRDPRVSRRGPSRASARTTCFTFPNSARRRRNSSAPRTPSA